MAENILFSQCLKLFFPIILIFNQITNSSAATFCSPLIPNTSTNFKCKYNGIHLQNCENPQDGTTVVISCNRFYEESSLKENPIRLCRDGRWSSEIPQCYSSPIYGADPTEARFKPNQNFGDPNISQRTCLPLTSNLSTNVTCVYNGTPLKNCQNPSEGTTVVISCRPFHERDSFDESPIPVCTNGQWSSSVPQCYPSYSESNLLIGSHNKLHRISCPSLTSSASTNFECKHNAKPAENCVNPVDGTTVFISCNPSYEEPSLEINPIRLCQNGVWSSAIPQCYPSNRAFYDPSVDDQTESSHICRSLTSTTTTNIKCEYHGIPLQNCKNPIDGTTVLISCNPFHKILSLGNNPNRILCRDGRWSSSIPQCYPISDIASSATSEKSRHHGGCLSLTSSVSTNIKCINNGKLLNNCENVANGTIALISCNPSYEESSLKNNPIRICRDGKWSSSIPECYPNFDIVSSATPEKSIHHHGDCPSLTSSVSTNIKCINNGKLLNNCENVANRTIALISCNPSYEESSLENNPIRICRNGKWSSSIPECYPTFDIASSPTPEKSRYNDGGCPSLTSSISTKIICINNDKLLNNCENVANGTIAVISCNPSYEESSLKNKPNRICRDGKWSSSIPECYPTFDIASSTTSV